MRRVLALLLVGFAAAAVSAQSAVPQPGDLSSVIDFSISTADLVELVRTEQYDRIPALNLILQGSVASTTLLDPNEETYQAVVELVSSEWNGLESISVYRVYVLLVGPDFADRVVERLPRNPGDEIIQTNTELLVIGQFLGVADAPDGSVIPVVQAVAVR